MSVSRLALVLGGGLALGALVATSTRRTSATVKTSPATAAPGTGGGGPGGPRLPGPLPISIRPPVPVVGIRPPVAARVPAGPAWPGDVAAGRFSGDVFALAAHIAKRRPLTLPYRAERVELADALIRIAAAEAFPLDLLTGHALAEGGGRACMTPTASSGAYGPLQVTRAACSSVNALYPPRDIKEALRVGVRYMRHLNRTYPEANNLTAALRVYGMGIGNYRKFLTVGCAGAQTVPVSVWRAECTATSYTGKVATETAQAAGAFHTLPLAWWAR